MEVGRILGIEEVWRVFFSQAGIFLVDRVVCGEHDWCIIYISVSS